MLRSIQDGHFRVSLDLSKASYELDCEPTYEVTRLVPTPEHGPSASWVSAAALNHKAKVVCDGVMGAVDLLIQRGTKTFPGKAEVLLKLAKGLLRKSAQATPASIVHLAIAVRAGGQSIDLGKLDVQLQADLAKAHEEIEAIKPISFYTRTEELQRIFRQDRWLQRKLDPSSAAAIANVLQRDAKLYDAYQRVLRLTERLTASFDAPTVLEPNVMACVIPPSRSAETTLLRALYGDQPIPEGWSLIDELVSRLRSGALDLSPRSNSGWYEYEQYALSALVTPESVPEAAKVSQSDEYRTYLLALFKTLQALTRETHAKQLPPAVAGGGGPREPTLYVEPELTVEPLIEHYLRRVMSLEFARALLRDTFGDDVLERTHGLRDIGDAGEDILTELTRLITLFRGAAGLAATEVGWDGFKASDADIDALRQWRLRSDPDLLTDTRKMLPVFFDAQRRLTKVWCMLGYEPRGAWVRYQGQPEVLGVEVVTQVPPPRSSRGSIRPELPEFPEVSKLPTVQFIPQRVQLHVPVMEEVYVREVMNRGEFRAFCNRFDTREQLLRQLRVAGTSMPTAD